MITQADLPPAVDRMRNNAMLAVGRDFGMAPPTPAELAEARELAGTLMDHKVVGIDTLNAVLAIQPASTLIYKEDGKVTGVSGQLILTSAAFAPLLAGAFDAVNLDTTYLAREGELVALGYGWGIAASTKPAGYAVSNAGRVIRETLFPNIATFTKAVTAIGRHVALTRYGYQPLRHPDDDLMISFAKQQAAAA
ncbi:MAG TPA: hypothetical protein VFE13_06385 [Caulobacteraceae bacterium]|jgi:hypothetical protein|nr:hypothetical protein [Caulobacteraceae bacterium]